MSGPDNNIVSLSTRPAPHAPSVGTPEGQRPPVQAPSGNHHSLSAGLSSSQVPAEKAGRGARLSAGTHMQRLNLKFSVADTDRIILMAQQRMTDLQIDVWFAKNQGRDDIAREEIVRICQGAGVKVKVDRR